MLSSKLTLLSVPALKASVGWQVSPPPKPKAAGAKRKAPEELDKVKAEVEELGFKVGHGCRHLLTLACSTKHTQPAANCKARAEGEPQLRRSRRKRLPPSFQVAFCAVDSSTPTHASLQGS